MLAYLIHFGYLLMLAGFLARDVLLLRALLLAAQVIVAVYAASIAVPAIAAWNGLFATVNAVWVVIIIRQRQRVRVPKELRDIHTAHFAAMSAGEFLRWWRLGERVMLRDEPLTRDGASPAWLYFILDGVARVTRSASTLADLPAGCFVGEMSLVTGAPANADVDALGGVTVQRWPRPRVEDLRARDLTLWVKVQSAIGADLVQKIERGDQRFTRP
jgi:hypothetical protein